MLRETEFKSHPKKVQVGKDQEKAQSEKDSHSNKNSAEVDIAPASGKVNRP